MTVAYIINNTAGLSVGVIPPTGENMLISDLRIYGMGHTLWGEGVDENQYRLTENFACPEKTLMPGVPQDDTDLGAGNGINNPLNGQLWYNTTTAQLFYYDCPSCPTIPGTWISLAAAGISYTKAESDARFVNVPGDTMTGALILFAHPTVLSPPLQAATKFYVDSTTQPADADLTSIAALTGTGIAVRSAPDTWVLRTITTNARLSVTNGSGVAGNPLLDITAITQGAGGSFSKFSVNGFGQVTSNTPVVVGDISALVDSRYVNTSGDTMTGALSMGSHKITSLTPGTAGTDAVNVDQLNAAIAAVPVGLNGSFLNMTGSRAFNTNFINSFGKDILVVVTIGGDDFLGRVIGRVAGIDVVESTASMGAEDQDGSRGFISFVVDAGSSYRVQKDPYAGNPGDVTIKHWYEYR